MSNENEIVSDDGPPPFNCSQCKFVSEIAVVDPSGNAVIGQRQMICLRNPPIPVIRSVMTPAGEQHGIIPQFPPVNESLFCYQFYPADDSEFRDEFSEAEFDLITGDPIKPDKPN